MDSSRTCVAVLRVHNKHPVAGQCAIRCSDRDRPGGGPCWNSGFDKAGIDKVEHCGCAVEENLAGVGEALPQDLHHSARSTINGQVGHERRQARIEAIEDTLAPVSAAERISIDDPVGLLMQRTVGVDAGRSVEVMERDYVSGQRCPEEHAIVGKSTATKRSSIEIPIGGLHQSYRVSAFTP